MSSLHAPPVPVPHALLPTYLDQHPDKPATELFKPYRDFEAKVRELYAQDPDHPTLKDPYVNVLPLFTEDTAKIVVRARSLATETAEEKAKYVMPLPDENRRLNGTPATVASLKDFQQNFAIFCESSLVDLNWDNVVAAGSSVVNCLLPVPDEYNKSKRSLREYYHEKFCPASDVDLFLYGLTDEEAVQKIKQIEANIRDSILAETTTVRTKHAITICSQYPTRHVQIVLRIYKSVSEILAGFDIDCSGAAYDGRQVYCTPRALQSYMTQVNHIDLSRRSPSYENRLSKYSHRNFEVYWPELDRSRIDPTIFDRSFRRTLGLARLLVLERLPTPNSRDSYAVRRREERGRPPIPNHYILYTNNTLMGNIKENFDDEVADWFNEDEVNNYDTFTIPYGLKYHAKKIEKLFYKRDLLLNAEWNQKDSRKVYLHRHPAFFGRAEDVTHDCCGFCPKPETDQEKEIAKEESKIYISGKISFIKDDPGRQQIGSFNPLTDDDWTEMAYIGNTARLCQAIVDGDLEHVQDWLDQEGANPNRRDYTGRTPLHLAVTSSTPDIVKALVDKGARLIARVADGKTALHLAAERGRAEIVKILMDKSTANEAEEAEKEDQRRKAKAQATKDKNNDDGDETNDSDDDGEMVENETTDDGVFSTTTASFVKVKGNDGKDATPLVEDIDDDEPDVYDVNVVAWDQPCSALHLAIVSGHVDVVKLLFQEYGADALLPVKFMGQNSQPHAALLTLVLALPLPVEKAKSMVIALLSFGATSSQADLNGTTVLQYYVDRAQNELVETLLEHDKTGTAAALNHISFPQPSQITSPLLSAIRSGNVQLVAKLLEAGAKLEVDYDLWLKGAKLSSNMEWRIRNNTFEDNNSSFKSNVDQPLITALESPNPAIALTLLDMGADPDTKTKEYYQSQKNAYRPAACPTALSVVQSHLKSLKQYTNETPTKRRPFDRTEGADAYLKSLPDKSYRHWVTSSDIKMERESYDKWLKEYEDEVESLKVAKGVAEKKAAIVEMISVLEKIEEKILNATKEPVADTDQGEKTDAYSPAKFNAKYGFVPRFNTTPDYTETRQPGYIELLEAAWRGDLDTIKKLTLTPWGVEKDQPPLTIAATDNFGNHAFSLAFLNGHYEVAGAILEIAQAQYAPIEEDKVRYEMDSDDNLDSEAYSDDGVKPTLFRTIIDNDQFTIDNIGQVNLQVQSKTAPMELMRKYCATFDGPDKSYMSPFQWVFRRNDHDGLKFLIDAAIRFRNLVHEGPTGTGTRIYILEQHDFPRMLVDGHTEMLAEVIKRTGVGLPLMEMVKDSGANVDLKPRYYQGLTVYGRKRTDWAEAGRNQSGWSLGIGSPLLHAASSGCLESVEWLLRDAPLRCYLEFMESKIARDDSRIKQLGQAPGGLEGAITRWLNSKDNEFVLLEAIKCIEVEKVMPLVKYLVKAVPHTINAKKGGGETPLYVACLRGLVDVASLLLSSGADPTVRQKDSCENLLHTALQLNPPARELRRLLELFEPEVRERMLCERSHHFALSQGRTPLHHWLLTALNPPGYYNDSRPYESMDELLDVMRLLLEYSGGRELSQLDGTGKTLLHSLVADTTHPEVVRTLLDAVPRKQQAMLIRRENAVGQTPAEVCWNKLVSVYVTEPRCMLIRDGILSVGRWDKLRAQDFAASDTQPVPVQDKIHVDETPAAGVVSYIGPSAVLGVVNEYAARCPGKRQLASLSEASDVAMRLGNRYQNHRYLTAVNGKDQAGKNKPTWSKLNELPGRFKDTAWGRTRPKD